jgi:hypothetical protein
MKCGAQMRLATIEPRDENYDVLTYRCTPCDSGESFLKARARTLPVQHADPRLRQHRPLVTNLDEPEVRQKPQILVADRRHLDPSGLNIP